jgi:iron complex transport system ATP-binding protein
MLQAKNLAVGYEKNNPLIKEINFQCQSSELIILLGVNGIGKSTLLKTVSGLLEPMHGTISFNGRDIFGLTAAERSKIISGVFTGRDFDPYISVREFVALGRYPYTNWLGSLTKGDNDKIKHALEALGLVHLSEKKVHQISDGERQKTLIAKALAQGTPVIIMDEPTAFLDYKNKAELLETIRALASTQNKTIILSTHDIAASLPYSTKAFLVTGSGKFIERINNNYTEQQLKAVMEEADQI